MTHPLLSRRALPLALLLAIVLSTPVQAQPTGKAALRFRCEGANLGAAVSINGQFKGECPFDVSVFEGSLKIRATKPAGPEHERVFEQNVRVAADSVKVIEVELGPQRFTAEGQRLRDERAAAERRAQAEREAQQRREEELRQAELRRQEAERAAQAAEAERQRLARFERQRAAAEGGDAEAMVVLAQAYEKGRDGLQRDRPQAFAWYNKAAQAGSVAGMGGLGAMYFNGWGTAHDYIQAEHWWRKAAQAGNGRAMFGLSVLYRQGWGGLPQDRAEMLRWLTAGAEAQEPRALEELGWSYAQGVGVPKDVPKAMALFDRQIQAGDVDAYASIGRMHELGWVTGVPQHAEARRWYQQGAERDCPTCIHNLGINTLLGQSGTERDPAKGAALLRRAAQLGQPGAMRKLGDYSLAGDKGIAKSEDEARRWYRQAVLEWNDEASADALARLEGMGQPQASGVPGPGLFCFAVMEVKDEPDTQRLFSRLWENTVPERGQAMQHATLSAFSTAVRAADPSRWHDFSQAQPHCTVTGICLQTVERILFGKTQEATQFCHPLIQHVQRHRARLMTPSSKTTPWLPEGASAR